VILAISGALNMDFAEALRDVISPGCEDGEVSRQG
jgi:hypothetical protein